MNIGDYQIIQCSLFVVHYIRLIPKTFKFQCVIPEQPRDEHLAVVKCCGLVWETELLPLYATDRTTYIFLHSTMVELPTHWEMAAHNFTSCNNYLHFFTPSINSFPFLSMYFKRRDRTMICKLGVRPLKVK